MAKSTKNQVGGLLYLSTLGINLVVTTAMGLGIGVLLDRWLHKTPLFTFIFFVLGIASGFWQIIKEINKLNASENK